MKRVPVRSSNLISVGYDSALRVLEAEFKHGSVYQYFGVPSMVYGLIAIEGVATV